MLIIACTAHRDRSSMTRSTSQHTQYPPNTGIWAPMDPCMRTGHACRPGQTIPQHAGTSPEHAQHIHRSLQLPVIGGFTQAEGAALGAFTTSGGAGTPIPDLDLGIHGFLLENGVWPFVFHSAPSMHFTPCACRPRMVCVYWGSPSHGAYVAFRLPQHAQHSGCLR